MKILHSFSGVAAISFPRGKPPKGTCGFATEMCLENCAATRVTNKNDTLGYRTKKRTYDFIINRPIFEVCAQVAKEMAEMEATVLYWFGAGDCPTKHIDKIVAIIKHFDSEKIPQCGFTRNREFWDKMGFIRKHFALTIEDIDIAKNDHTLHGLVAIPDYKTGSVNLYFADYDMYPGGTCAASKYTAITGAGYEAHCDHCLKNKRGCFIKWDQR